jgi:hypothetical protein
MTLLQLGKGADFTEVLVTAQPANRHKQLIGPQRRHAAKKIKFINQNKLAERARALGPFVERLGVLAVPVWGFLSVPVFGSQ